MYRTAKPLLDFVAASTALVLLSPLLLSIAVLVKAGSRGPVFYRGRRVGRLGRPFRIFKFRTMVVNAEQIGGSSSATGDPRVTRLGAFLRRFKLDELPQLINVVCGEMSLVGPRPEVDRYVAMYTPQEKPILDAKPGITDWASIWNADEGAVLAGYADPEQAYEKLIRPTKLALQLKYVQEVSFLTDARIILATLIRLLHRSWRPRELHAYADPVGAAPTIGEDVPHGGGAEGNKAQDPTRGK